MKGGGGGAPFFGMYLSRSSCTLYSFTCSNRGYCRATRVFVFVFVTLLPMTSELRRFLIH